MPANNINQYPDISIVILSKNGAPYLKQALEIIFRQKVPAHYDVLIIDSGSTDSTLEIIARYPVRLVTIPPQTFGHGRTRNLGARLAKGKIVVFLNGDATPINELWLSNLIKHFDRDSQIAGVYSRSIPRHDCNPLRARELLADPTYAFGETVVKRIEDKETYARMEYGQKRIFVAFETISCAIKRDFLQHFAFDDNIEFGEDLEWSKRIMEAGFSIVFEPASQVVHSHDFYCSPIETLRKFFDDAKLNSDLFGFKVSLNPVKAIEFISSGVSKDLRYLAGLQHQGRWYKAKWAIYALLARSAQYIGMVLGCYSRKIPQCFYRHLSLVAKVKK